MEYSDFFIAKDIVAQIQKKEAFLAEFDYDNIKVVVTGRNGSGQSNITTIGIDSTEHDLAPFANVFIDSVKEKIKADIQSLHQKLKEI